MVQILKLQCFTHTHTHAYICIYIYIHTRVFYTHSYAMETKSLSGGISDCGVVLTTHPHLALKLRMVAATTLPFLCACNGMLRRGLLYYTEDLYS